MTQSPPLDIVWTSTRSEFLVYEKSLVDRLGFDPETALAGEIHVSGYCAACGGKTRFAVCTGARFDGRPNLREGMQCARCGLSARQRLVHLAFASSARRDKGLLSGKGAILERHSRLFRALRNQSPRICGSEYQGGDAAKGKTYLRLVRGRLPLPKVARHESITEMSYADESLDYLIHTDVLEHVEDTRGALEECRRVLKVGAPLIFTVPFFSSLGRCLVRGRTGPDGKLVELMPGEYHDDGNAGTGIYTFYNFGWSLVELIRDVFPTVEIGVAYDVERGLLFCDSKHEWWNMAPLVFRCYR